MLTSQLIQLFFVECPIVPQPLHFLFKTLGIIVSEHIHQVVNLLFVLSSCK